MDAKVGLYFVADGKLKFSSNGERAPGDAGSPRRRTSFIHSGLTKRAEEMREAAMSAEAESSEVRWWVTSGLGWETAWIPVGSGDVKSSNLRTVVV